MRWVWVALMSVNLSVCVGFLRMAWMERAWIWVATFAVLALTSVVSGAFSFMATPP